MGYAKYHEDIIEAIIDSGFYDRVSNYVTKSVEPPIFRCSYCNLSFYSKNDLYEHIKKAHNVVSSLLIVNGKVVHNECYVKELKSLIIIRYDLNDSIYINKEKLLEYETLNEIDVADKFYQCLLTNKTISVSVGEKNFKVHLISQEHINVDKINSIISRWSMETSSGLHIQKDTSSSNEIEKRCDDSYWALYEHGMPIASDKEAKKSETFTCVDQRNSIAKLIISDGLGQKKDSTLAILNIPVLADKRFGDDIYLEAKLDKDIILHISANSKMVQGYSNSENYSIRKSAEIYKMCFGLEIVR